VSKIKVAELFYSLQGEGKYIGVPSIFLRTFGCNFTCDGFGMAKGVKSTERLAVDASKYDDYKKLPLVHTGCDSYASWDPRFKHLSPMLTVEAIVDEMQKLLPGGKFGRDKHLIITGGEPLLGWQKSYPDLIDEIINRKMELTDITFETNGTQVIHPDLFEYLTNAAPHVKVTWSVSSKLSVSGEKWHEAIKPSVVFEYMNVPYSDTYFKFVVATADDIQDVYKAVAEYKEYGIDYPVYLMPVGGTNDSYIMNERNVADFCRDNGFRFSPRIQVPLYKNAWGT
jgi:6-pyruvoyltetrahydropterin 2'-reductase